MIKTVAKTVAIATVFLYLYGNLKSTTMATVNVMLRKNAHKKDKIFPIIICYALSFTSVFNLMSVNI